MGIRVVVKDHWGEVQVVLAASRSAIQSAAVAECWALLRAVTLCNDLGLRCVQFEGDAKLVVDAVNKNSPDYSWNGQLIEDIKSTLLSHQHWTIQHVTRTGNKAVDAAAKLGLLLSFEHIWMEEEPFEAFPLF
ncbi:uncharacterized protein LOC121238099 [Juglans microcarpa x Juglans regia]|uniref:uncharacterized protein LOC121238099 n=1 Tax=Juglans microcarpa x Juglans regia TaxID=2249226 RepID=UPI001B7DBEC4|nr:uncharacterized protein LOC121238099 [Juglans microcarpa x Juglans regia]